MDSHWSTGATRAGQGDQLSGHPALARYGAALTATSGQGCAVLELANADLLCYVASVPCWGQQAWQI